MIKINSYFHLLNMLMFLGVFFYFSILFIEDFSIFLLVLILGISLIMYFFGKEFNIAKFYNNQLIYTNPFKRVEIPYDRISKVILKNARGGSYFEVFYIDESKDKVKVIKLKVFSDSHSKLLNAFKLLEENNVNIIDELI